MIQKITQKNWYFWTGNLIMWAKNVNQSLDFPVRRTGSYSHKKSTGHIHELEFKWDLTWVLWDWHMQYMMIHNTIFIL